MLMNSSNIYDKLNLENDNNYPITYSAVVVAYMMKNQLKLSYR
jgi:hypothetical protein